METRGKYISHLKVQSFEFMFILKCTFLSAFLPQLSPKYGFLVWSLHLHESTLSSWQTGKVNIYKILEH